VQLKRAQRLTAKELAARLGVSLNAARHHLKELEAEGLVEYERKHRGVGAPSFAYRLSPAGEALFPRRYQETLTAVLDQIVERDGREAAVAVLESHFAALGRKLQAELAGSAPAERLHALGRALSEEGYMAEVTAGAGSGTLTEHNCAISAVALLESYFAALARRVEGELTDATPAERLEAIRRVLSEEGYMAEVAAHGSGAILREHNCAIPAVAQRFPEICAAELRFLADVLGAEVDRREHMLSGCSACEYHVRFKPAQEIS
jgi:DeoR family suf operon transcriptional repressor